MKEELLNLIKESLEIESREITLDDRFSDFPEWDSLAQLTLMAVLDEKFGLNLNSAEFNSIKTIGDLLIRIEVGFLNN